MAEIGGVADAVAETVEHEAVRAKLVMREMDLLAAGKAVPYELQKEGRRKTCRDRYSGALSLKAGTSTNEV